MSLESNSPWEFHIMQRYSFLEFDSSVFIAILSIHNQRFFNLTKYREVIVNNSLLTLYAETQICFWY